MGAVYKAVQRKLNRKVALKLLPERPETEGFHFAQRFEREAQAMAQLSHPHIVGVYDFGECPAGLYFVMEYVEGADLHRVLATGELTMEHFHGWVPQICAALHYAHRSGVVHRDIKPANILITQGGDVKIADFGLAKLAGAEHAGSNTATNLSMGTPDYAAPEQIAGDQPVDHRADIYAIGVVMYQMLTGKLPRGAYPLPSEVNRACDKRIDRLVLRAMQSEPGDRFADASDIVTSLTHIRSQPKEPVALLVHDQNQPPRKHLVLANAAGTAAAGTTTGAGAPALRKPTTIPARKTPPPSEPGQPLRRPWRLLWGGGLLVVITLAVFAQRHGETQRGLEREAKLAAAGIPLPKPVVEPTEPRPAATPGPPEGPGNTPAPGLAEFRDKLGVKRTPGSQAPRLPELETSGRVFFLPFDRTEADELPVGQVPARLKNVADVWLGFAIGRNHLPTAPFALALDRDGHLTAWGDNELGQSDPPEALEEKAIAAVAVGAAHAMALTSEGAVHAWGDNRQGQCEVPAALSGVTALAAGRAHSLALLADGRVVGWGSAASATVPADLGPVQAIAAGNDFSLALQRDGRLRLWGRLGGQAPVEPPEGTRVKSIAATPYAACALLEDGSGLTWETSQPVAATFGKDGGKADQLIPAGAAIAVRLADSSRWQLRPPSRQPSSVGAGLSLNVGNRLHDSRIALTRDFALVWKPEKRKQATPPAPVEAPPPRPPTEATRRIAELQATFGKAYAERVSQPFDEAVAKLNGYYAGHLTNELAKAPPAIQDALRAEIEAVRTAAKLPPQDEPGLGEPLLSLRATYRQSRVGHEQQRRQSEAELLAQYDRALLGLQDELAGAEKLEEALEVKQFREQLAARTAPAAAP